MYKCSGCDFESSYKSNVVRHINKGKKCSSIELLNVIKISPNISCEDCGKKVSDANSMNRHIRICKKKLKNVIKNKEIDPDRQINNCFSNNTKKTKPQQNGELKKVHIYLLQEREFIKLNQPIYKIGYTTAGLKRFKNYPHDSDVLLVKIFDNCNPEKELIALFKNIFRLCVEIGKEYFEGDKNHMMDLIYNFGRT
jgi:hypothetical protein